MPSAQRVHVTHTYASDPATVFEKLADHDKLSPVFHAKVTRVKDGDTTRNGVGSVRRLKIWPLPSFEETTTTAEPNSLIEYRITKGHPVRNHWAVQRLTPTANGGTHLDYTIGFDMPVPGAAALIAMIITVSLNLGLPRLTA